MKSLCWLIAARRFAITIISCWQRRNPESEYVVSSSICAIGKSIYWAWNRFKHVIITRGYGDIIWPFLEMNSKRLTKEWFDDLRLSLSEQLMLRLLMAGMTMEEVAVNLNTSLKAFTASVLRFMSGWG